MSIFGKSTKISVGNLNRKEAEKVIDKVRKDYETQWTPPTLDQICDSLEEEYKFSSTGEAMSIMRLVQFYREHKNDN